MVLSHSLMLLVDLCCKVLYCCCFCCIPCGSYCCFRHFDAYGVESTMSSILSATHKRNNCYPQKDNRAIVVSLFNDSTLVIGRRNVWEQKKRYSHINNRGTQYTYGLLQLLKHTKNMVIHMMTMETGLAIDCFSHCCHQLIRDL